MRRTVLAAVGIAMFMLLAACAHEKTEMPSYLDIPPSPADTIGTQPLINDVRLAGTSPPVRAAFMHDFPNAGISTIRPLKTSTGQLLYQITFIQNGQPDIVVYSDSGMMVTPPANVAPIPPGVNLP